MKFRYGYLTLILTFLLGIHEGFVALWIPPSPEPAVVFPYRAESLPPADLEKLEEGIPLQSREELMQLLEDYLS